MPIGARSSGAGFFLAVTSFVNCENTVKRRRNKVIFIGRMGIRDSMFVTHYYIPRSKSAFTGK